jgi:microcystin-dependent protein
VPYLGEIRMFAGTFVPRGWLLCDGSVRKIDDYETLHMVIQTTYGGDGTKTFALPDFRGRAPMHDFDDIAGQDGAESVALTVEQLPAHTHELSGSHEPGTVPDPDARVLARTGPSPPSVGLYFEDDPAVEMAASSIAPTGGGKPHENRQPYVCFNFIICVEGDFPIPDGGSYTAYDPIVGEVRAFGFQFAPRGGWERCDGQTLEVKGHTALFGVLGTSYGGDGVTTIAVPDLRNRVPLSSGKGPGLSDYKLGDSGGSWSVTLSEAQLPSHAHPLKAVNSIGDTGHPSNASLARYAKAYQTNTTQNLTAVMNGLWGSGAGHGHNNMMPYLPLMFCICVEGVIPARPA